MLKTLLPEDFWKLADDTRIATEYLADTKLQYLKSAPPEMLRSICLQYRYFVRDYPNNLAVLVSKTPYGDFKSLIAHILADELGSGLAEKAHLKLWDNFLLSIELEPEVLEDSVHPENLKLLKQLQQLTREQTMAYVIGLCGMGGECLCQVYLTAMYKYIMQNPYLKANQHNIDWEFWHIHVGEEDIKHRHQVRQTINEIVKHDPKCIADLAAGYEIAKSNWDSFWGNSYQLSGLTFAAFS
ncbi:MAG: iron-containing redox enzyme family protein [Leptolyngbyaceae cyanobacterium MO_188.B28]|nr:iron-containing redox enzyme family protein [Leptolyngbyaceae cyanobacterium MO_188.B28]